MITVSHLSKGFVSPDGDWTQAVKDVSFHVSGGEVVGIIGSSGSGKSVLLRCMAGLEQPTEGEVILTPGVKIGMVFQQFNLFANLSIIDNITLAPMKLLKLSKSEAEQRAKTLLERIGLADKAQAYPSQLSGGQQQRVAIARALASAPAIILADEPTGNLDSKTTQDVMGLLKVTSQKFGQTIVMITHNDEIAQLADRSIRIEDGLIVRG